MQKWWYIFLFNLKSSNTYRLNIMSSLFARVVRLLGMLIVWHVAIKSGSSAFSFNQIFTYYIIGELFMVSTSPHWSIGVDVMKGDVAAKLVKPINLWIYYWVEDLGIDFTTNIFNIILVLILAVIGYSYILLPQSLPSFALFILFCVLAYAINLILSYIIGFASFYITNIRGVSELASQIQLFMSGRLFPLSVLSPLIWLEYLPFAFTFYVPVQVYLGHINHRAALEYMGLGLIWLLVLYGIARILYNRGLKLHEGVGL